jgi:hypothetical protein
MTPAAPPGRVQDEARQLGLRYWNLNAETGGHVMIMGAAPPADASEGTAAMYVITSYYRVHERSPASTELAIHPCGRCATPARYPVHRAGRCPRPVAGVSAAPKVAALHGGGVSLAAAADAFLSTPRTANPNTHRAYASAIDRTITRLGRDRPLAEIADAESARHVASGCPSLPAASLIDRRPLVSLSSACWTMIS